MALSIVSGSEQLSTPSSTVPLNPEPLRQAALAPGKLAAAIGQDVGGLFQDVSQQVQDVRNTKKVFDADLKMRATKDQFMVDIVKDPNLASDPGTWVPEYQKRVKATEDSVLSQPDLAPVVKRHLNMMAAQWGAATTSEIRTHALNREVDDTKEAGFQVATAALSNGDGDTAAATYRLLNKQGVIGPQYTAALIRQIPAKVAEAQANANIASDPIHAPDVVTKLKDKLPDKTYRTLLNVANEAQKRAQGENAEDLSSRVDDSPDHAIDPKLLKAWRDNGKINANQYERINNRVDAYAKKAKADQSKQETDEFYLAMMDADNAPTDGKALQSWAARVKTDGLGWTNPALRQRLNEYVDRKVENVQKSGRAEDKPIETTILNEMRQGMQPYVNSITDPDDTAHYLDDDTFKERYGQDADRQQVADRFRLQKARQADQMRNWFKDNPEATQEEAEEARMKIEQPSVMREVKDRLVPASAKPQYVKGKTYTDAAGNKATWDGDKWVEVK